MSNQAIGLGVYGRTDVGRVRKRNEDAFVIADLMETQPIHSMQHPLKLEVGGRGVLLAVSDGMGGAQAGDVASALTLHSLRRGMTTNVGSTSAEAALTSSVERANRRVWDTAVSTGREGMGATLTAILIDGTHAYVAEVGDSRAYVLRAGRLVQLTHDQSCVQLMLDAGTLTREEAENFQYKNVIMQAMGTKPDVVVALNRFDLRSGDKMLLCSDGLSGKVSNDELESILRSASRLDVACGQLIDLANSRGGEDNITVLLASVWGDALPATVGDERVHVETVQEFTG